MGLRTAIARLAARHAHVLVVEVARHWEVRAAVERAVLARGWSLASSPADADVLAVCGHPGPKMAEAIEAVWQQLPGPRTRIDVHERGEAAATLCDVHTRMLDTAEHQRDARDRPSAAELLGMSGDHEDMDMSGGDDDMDMDMDMGDMDMDMAPGGIPLAEGGEDRDGLEMDVLHLPLGPVLPYWPAGLVVRCPLQGDVIVNASAELLDAQPEADPGTTPERSAARSIDNLVSLLALAGWEEPAAEARNVRDRLLGGGSPELRQRFDMLQRRIRRSRMLRWSLRDIRPLTADDADRKDLPAHWVGDTHDRLLAALDRIARALDGEPDPHSAATTSDVAHLVTGLDLATARLVVASLDLHTITSDATSGVNHGR